MITWLITPEPTGFGAAMAIELRDLTSLAIFGDGTVVIYRTEIILNGRKVGGEEIFAIDEPCLGLEYRQRLAFANGVARVFDHFTGRSWRIGMGGEHLFINPGRPRRLKNVQFSDVIFIDDVVEEGSRLTCFFSGECRRRADIFRRPRRHSKVRGPKKNTALVSRGELPPGQVRRGAVWAINWLRAVFFPQAERQLA